MRTQLWVQGQDQTSITGFNNTYLGNFVGSVDPDGTHFPTKAIRSASATSRTGTGPGPKPATSVVSSHNPQPVGGNVVVVTLNLDTDQLGFDGAVARGGNAPATPHRNAPQPRVRPDPANHAMLNQKVEELQATVTQQQATVAQQQKQIETLTAQLREQAAQIQKVSAQVELIKPTPRVVENR